MVNGLITQFTTAVTNSPRGCWRIAPMEEKSTASIIGKIIPQISTAIGRLIPTASRAAMLAAASGNKAPRPTPATIARAIQKER